MGKEQGRLDILVNNVWGGYESFEKWYDPFWEQPLWRWEKMFSTGVRAHYTASHFAVPRMFPNCQGLIVSTTFWDRGKCLTNLFYDLAKTAINRIAYAMALELREHNIAAVALSPGWMRTEEVLREYGITPDELNYQVFEDHDRTESVYYIGWAVAALAADPNVMEKSGRILAVGDLAREYGFTDIDGSQPPAYRMKEEHLRDWRNANTSGIYYAVSVANKSLVCHESYMTSFQCSHALEHKTQTLRVQLHSDHTVGFPDLILMSWLMGREVPLQAYGPIGLQVITEHSQAACAGDIRERLEGLLILYYQLFHGVMKAELLLEFRDGYQGDVVSGKDLEVY